MRAAHTLRTDTAMWQEAMSQLLSPNAHAGGTRCLALFLTLVAEHREWVGPYLTADIREVGGWDAGQAAWGGGGGGGGR